MNALNEKRLATISIAFIIIFTSYVLCESLRIYISILALLWILYVTVSLFFLSKPRTVTLRKIVTMILMLASTLGAIAQGALFISKTEKTAQMYVNTERSATAYITDIYYEESYGAAYQAVLTEIDGTTTDLGVILELPFSASLSLYDTVTFQGVYTEIDGEFSSYRKADGVWLTASAQAVQKIGTTEKPVSTFLARMRKTVTQAFQRYFEPTEAGFATALLIGNKDALDGNIRLAFTRVGISHLLAVSGLHLSVIIGGADLLLRALTIPKKKKNFLLILLTAFFACFCGLSASILRSALMLSLYYVTDLFGEANDAVTSLSFSAFLILLFHPRSIYDVGFWLSCLSTLGILCVMPALNFSFLSRLPRLLKAPIRFFLSSLGMTLASTFFTMPVIYLSFGGISLLSPVANLIFIPLTQIILYLLLFLTLFSWLPFLASMVAFLSKCLISVTVSLAESLSDIEGIYLSLRYPFALYILIALILGVLTILLLRKARPVWLFAVFISCTVVFGAAYGVYQGLYHDASYLYLRSDGKSDMITLINGKEVMFIDITTGGSAMPMAAYRDLSDFYACEIDTYLLTHYHSYHPNTLRKLSENIKIHRLLLPEPLTENDRRYSEQIASVFNGEIEYYRSGEETLGNLTLTLPQRRFLARSEHPVITFSASFSENHQSFAYLSSSALEITAPTETLVLLGSHGPIEKHIFDPALLQHTRYVVFADRKTAALTELDRISAAVFYAQDHDGYFRILFDDGD